MQYSFPKAINDISINNEHSYTTIGFIEKLLLNQCYIRHK